MIVYDDGKTSIEEGTDYTIVSCLIDDLRLTVRYFGETYSISLDDYPIFNGRSAGKHTIGIWAMLMRKDAKKLLLGLLSNIDYPMIHEEPLICEMIDDMMAA